MTEGTFSDVATHLMFLFVVVVICCCCFRLKFRRHRRRVSSLKFMQGIECMKSDYYKEEIRDR